MGKQLVIHRPIRRALTAVPLLLVLIGCASKWPVGEGSVAQPASITDRDWVLVKLGERSSPGGARNQPVTLRLEAATSRAAGFAGCNRFTASYVLSTDRLSFGPVASTRMACAEVGDLEQSFLAALAKVTMYRVAGGALALGTSDGPLMWFRVP